MLLSVQPGEVVEQVCGCPCTQVRCAVGMRSSVQKENELSCGAVLGPSPSALLKTLAEFTDEALLSRGQQAQRFGSPWDTRIPLRGGFGESFKRLTDFLSARRLRKLFEFPSLDSSAHGPLEGRDLLRCALPFGLRAGPVETHEDLTSLAATVNRCFFDRYNCRVCF